LIIVAQGYISRKKARYVIYDNFYLIHKDLFEIFMVFLKELEIIKLKIFDQYLQKIYFDKKVFFACKFLILNFFTLI